MLFQYINNARVEPILSVAADGHPIAADGVNVLTLEQAADRSQVSARELRGLWEAAFGAAIPDVEIADDPTAVGEDRPDHALRADLTEAQQLALEHELRYPHLTASQFELFDQMRRVLGIPRFCRAIHPYVRIVEGRPVVEMHTSIQHLREIALASPSYDGEDPLEFCGQDGRWTQLWQTEEPPVAARARVYRFQHGRRIPFEAIARWAAYAPYLIGSRGEQTLPEAWQRRNAEQLGKCAMALVLRAAYGTLLKGLYTHDEMDQARAATAQQKQVVAPAPLIDDTHIRRQVDDLMDSQLDVFDQIENPPKTEQQFNEMMTEVIPDHHVRSATIAAFRSRFRTIANANKPLFWASVIVAARQAKNAQQCPP